MLPSSFRLAPAVPTEYPVLVEVWESAVRATHHFLQPDDLVFYRAMLQNGAFDSVTLTTLRNPTDEIIGFLGVAGDTLEMLFVRADARGQGYGTILLRHALDALGTTAVDVNEANSQALGFYERFGFRITHRSPLDGAGKPYPILHLHR